MKKKYALEEHERRFLCTLPDSLPTSFRKIHDLYLDSTRLRLREVFSSSGSLIERKLTQKVQERGKIFVTNTYLDSKEFQKLSAIEGNHLRKNRYTIERTGNVWAVDVFRGHLEGLILAEFEAGSEEEIYEIDLPEFVVEEVTHDDFFTGGHLVKINRLELEKKIAQPGSSYNSGQSLRD